MRTRILAGSYAASTPLTTADAARMLEVTTRRVRGLAHDQDLAGRTTRSGQWLFEKADVARLVHRRAEQRLAGVARLRPKKRGAPGEPHQLSLFRGKLIRSESRFVSGPGNTPRAIAEDSERVR